MGTRYSPPPLFTQLPSTTMTASPDGSMTTRLAYQAPVTPGSTTETPPASSTANQLRLPSSLAATATAPSGVNTTSPEVARPADRRTPSSVSAPSAPSVIAAHPPAWPPPAS